MQSLEPLEERSPTKLVGLGDGHQPDGGSSLLSVAGQWGLSVSARTWAKRWLTGGRKWVVFDGQPASAASQHGETRRTQEVFADRALVVAGGGAPSAP